jgi:hypothetical protein
MFSTTSQSASIKYRGLDEDEILKAHAEEISDWQCSGPLGAGHRAPNTYSKMLAKERG